MTTGGQLSARGHRGGAAIGSRDPKSFEAFRQVRARMERITYADMDREMGVFGDPENCIARVRELQTEYGFDEFICYFNQGGRWTPRL